MVRVRCARAIPSAEGWISGWDGVGWEGVMLLFSRVPSGPTLLATRPVPGEPRGKIRSRFGPLVPFANQRRFIGNPSRVRPLAPKNFSVADVINRQTLGRKAQVALPLNYFRQK